MTRRRLTPPWCTKACSESLSHRFLRLTQCFWDGVPPFPETKCRGRNEARYPAVFTSDRSTSATLHAWATQPRGVYGGSASKISLIDPTHASDM